MKICEKENEPPRFAKHKAARRRPLIDSTLMTLIDPLRGEVETPAYQSRMLLVHLAFSMTFHDWVIPVQQPVTVGVDVAVHEFEKLRRNTQ